MRIHFFALTALIFSSVLLTQAQTPDSDFQVWNETTFAFPVVKSKDEKGKETDRLSLLLFGSFRLGQNRLYPADARVGAGFEYRINKYFSISPTYVYRRGEPLRNRKEFEHRIRFDFSAEKKWKPFSIKDRNRVEYRVRNFRGDALRYRNKFTFRVPVNRDGKEIFAPFAAEELTYDFSLDTLTTIEFSAGIAKKFNNVTSAEFFYVRRDFRSSALKHLHGVGVNLKFRID